MWKASGSVAGRGNDHTAVAVPPVVAGLDRFVPRVTAPRTSQAEDVGTPATAASMPSLRRRLEVMMSPKAVRRWLTWIATSRARTRALHARFGGLARGRRSWSCGCHVSGNEPSSPLKLSNCPQRSRRDPDERGRPCRESATPDVVHRPSSIAAQASAPGPTWAATAGRGRRTAAARTPERATT
jgi:hypothetical protein